MSAEKMVDLVKNDSKNIEQDIKREIWLDPKENLFDNEILSKLNYGELKVNPTILGEQLVLRSLNKIDYKRGYLNLLTQLTSVGQVSEEQFNRQFDLMRNCLNTYFIIVIEDRVRNQVIGSATLHVEFKFIHETSLRGRIEDVVVDDANRGRQLGKILLETVKLLAKYVGCYKLSLDCKDNMITYYNSIGFICEPDIFKYWLDGYTAQESAQFVKEKESSVLGNVPDALIVSDILDQNRQFNLIEKHLQNPAKSFADEYAFLITPKSIKLLIEKYYEFDDQVIREILGKKLSGKNRKDYLSDVSERTKVNLKSCRRQFDNVKRVYKTVEEMPGNLIVNIQNQFLLPELSARRYATVVFVANNRFETNKRKLQYLRFEDFLYCATEMINNWTCKTRDCKYEEETLECCRYFLLSLRELKVVLEREYLDELRALFYKETKGSFNEKKFNEIDASFKSITRNIINIAIGLNHSKEIKDLFIDIVEKVCEPCKQIKLSQADMSLFINNLYEVGLNLSVCKANGEIRNVWKSFMRTLGNCIIKMYH